MSKAVGRSNRHKLQVQMRQGLVIFVEGATEAVFYKRMVEFLREGQKPVSVAKPVRIIDLGGVTRFQTKPGRILEKRLRPKYPGTDFVVACAYDTDAFDQYQKKPPVDWSEVGDSLRSAGAISVVEIKAQQTIEDWFLADLPGICRYLGISGKTKLVGTTGLSKLQHLFRNGNRIYAKGEETEEFINYLDMGRIYKAHATELKKLRQVLIIK